MAKGMPTGSKVKMLGTNIWLTSVSYYNDKGRAVQTRRQLYDGSNGGTETTSSLYDFFGKVTHSKQSQALNGTTTTLEQWNTYDHMGRLARSEQEVNGENWGQSWADVNRHFVKKFFVPVIKHEIFKLMNNYNNHVLNSNNQV